MTLIDMNVYNMLKEATGAEFIHELVNAFLEDTPVQFEQMRSALAAGDSEVFCRAAHTIKSNAATLGANQLASLARELEKIGREGNLAVGSRLEVLHEAFEQVKNQLDELS
ncbi:MAG: Hpt domain-containing protein [Chloroflexi bacterium]|nr:Hpt domain-containing protein [Chloroflexota bacterium]